jgi:hypothetical protein
LKPAVESAIESKRERFLAALCAALCVACLVAIFLFVKTSRPVESDIALLSSQDEGRLVAVFGKLAAPSLRDSGFYGVVCASACVSFFVPPQLASEISATRVDLARLRSGAKLRVEGLLREDSRAAGGFRIEAVTPNSLELLG